MNLGSELRWFGVLPRFDPGEGITVASPEGSGKGYWAGAPSSLYDPVSNKFYLSYRLRSPKERGYRCIIGESEDGVHFREIWSVRKELLNANSIEGTSLLKDSDGNWLFYISYEDSNDKRWKVDLLKAESPGNFKVERRKRVLEPEDYTVASIKDPFACIVGNKLHLFVCFSPKSPKWDERTALLISDDGENFQWVKEVLSPGKGWDANCARITSIAYLPPIFLAFWDGREFPEQSTEEKASLAYSFDLLNF
ncbi:hypothetical protein H5T87_11105 [bacterium]|nr:hypothetical protein [bacterium]